MTIAETFPVKVSVVVPVYNEEKFIGNLIDNLRRQDYPGDLLEIFLIDGMSQDKTREIIAQAQKETGNIRLLINEKRFVPHALNLGISRSSGEVIIRMDAHSSYPENYISTLVRSLIDLKADNVGGIWKTLPSGDSLKAKAIALAQSSGFGVGNSHFRIGTGSVRKVDTVPYGCFPRSLFDKIGMFDEELLRNQDDEFNARIIGHGGDIYLIPEVVIDYHARPDIASSWRMFYQYAYFKPLVNTKLRRPATIRQFIPPLFVLFLVAGWSGSLIHPALIIPYLAGAGSYLLLNIFFSLQIAIKQHQPLLLFYLPWLFFLQHLAYGWGYLAGIVKFVILRKRVTAIRSSR